MADHWLYIQVALFEEDADGNVVAHHSQHREGCLLPDDPAVAQARRDEYHFWAYRGFNLARNGPLGFPERDKESGATTPALALLVLKTPQVEAVRAFYQRLRILFAEERHKNGPLHFAGAIGNLVLEIYPLPEGDVVDRTTRLGFTVADLGEVLETVRAHGAPVLSPPRPTTWGTRAVVQDPDGRAVELYQR